MADKIFFKTGSASSLPTTKTAGQLLFAIDGTTGSIYLDKDSKTRIKFNADAVKLATPRSINGTTFDGSTDITTTNWGTARNISISDATGANTGTAVSVNGSQAVTLKLPATLVATLKGNADTATKATSADKATVSESCTGNAATATKLKSGVSINGSTFDGTAGITTAKWGTARIITVSDNTGNYTQTNSGIDGSANFTLKLPATITATLIGNADSATYATTAGTANSAKACTGNAATATKLKAGVAINGTTFDGSTAITTAKWGTAHNISIGNSDGTGAGTAVSVDGSGAVTLKLPSEIKANVTSAGKLSGDSSDVGDTNTPVYFENGIPKPITSIDVKSDKAGKLDPGATINGTLFTGESNITTTTWGAARTLTIGNTGKSVNGSGNVSWTIAEIGALALTGGTITGKTYINTSSGANPFYIMRNGGTTESTAFWQDDSQLHLDVTNDETTAGISFKLSATDTENSDGSKASSGTITFSMASGTTTITADKFSGAATKLATARNIAISGTASSSIGTFDGSGNTTIYIPTTITGFESISTKKIVSPASTALYITPASTLYLDSGSGSSIIFRQGGTARARFDTTGLLRPESNNVSDLGSASYKWKNVYATTFTGALSGNATTATTLATPRALRISDTANSSSTASFNGSADATLYIPTTIKGFTSIESDKFVVNDKVTLQYNTTNECLEFVFA